MTPVPIILSTAGGQFEVYPNLTWPQVIWGVSRLIILPLLAIILWIVALISILKTGFKENSSVKVFWLLITLILPILGPLLYFFFGKKHLNKQGK